MNRYLLPLGIFLVLVVFLGIGLGLNPREIPSPLIDKPAPAFDLVQLHEPRKSLTKQDMQGKVWLLNVWASWCASCREEHPVLVELAKTKVVPIVGLNYKDQRPEALRRAGDFCISKPKRLLYGVHWDRHSRPAHLDDQPLQGGDGNRNLNFNTDTAPRLAANAHFPIQLRQGRSHHIQADAPA